MHEFKAAKSTCKTNVDKLEKKQQTLIKVLTQGFSILTKSMIKLSEDITNKQNEIYDNKLKDLENGITFQDLNATKIQNMDTKIKKQDEIIAILENEVKNFKEKGKESEAVKSNQEESLQTPSNFKTPTEIKNPISQSILIKIR